MSTSPTVLVVGATGSIGRLVVAEVVRRGWTARALVRDAARARGLDPGAEVVVGDLTRADSLDDAVAGVDAVVLTHGTHGGDADGFERVDYGGVLNVLTALGARPARIALMTAIGVTGREGAYNRATGAHDWKRRSERLVRASGRGYTIVRPGWFDYHEPDERRLVLLQGDLRQAGDSSDGAIAREDIARVLVDSLGSGAADRRTFELVAERGASPDNLDPLLGALDADPADALDAVHDADNMPVGDEPPRVRDDLERVRGL